MFFDCGELRNESQRVKELRKIRQQKKKEQKIRDISENDADEYLWRKVYNIYNIYEMGNNGFKQASDVLLFPHSDFMYYSNMFD